jgi:UDP-glucose 4-epimerase
VQFNVTDSVRLDEVCKGVDMIVHCAAMNEVDCAARPEDALIVNGLGTLKLLRAAEKASVSRFIYFSTAHVYGTPLAGRIEETRLARPTHPYAITHKVAEDFVLSAHDQRRLTGIVLRLSNAFGVPITAEVERWTLLVNDLCRQAVTEKKIVLRSPGLQRRDFIPLSDVARAVEHCLSLPAREASDGLFNLGGKNTLTVHDMARRIANLCDRALEFHPPLERPLPSSGATGEELDYVVEKFERTGFCLQGDPDAEIAATLRFCQQNAACLSGTA